MSILLNRQEKILGTNDPGRDRPPEDSELHRDRRSSEPNAGQRPSAGDTAVRPGGHVQGLTHQASKSPLDEPVAVLYPTELDHNTKAE